MTAVHEMRRLPFSISSGLWPEEWEEMWNESLVVNAWTVNHRGTVKQAVGRYLAFANFTNSAVTPTEETIRAFARLLDMHLSGSTVVTYMEHLAYGLLVIFPSHDWQWLQEFNRSLRREKIKYAAPTGSATITKTLLRTNDCSLPFDQWELDEKERWVAAFRAEQKSLSQKYVRRDQRQTLANENSPDSKSDGNQKHPSLWSDPYVARISRGWGMFRHWCHKNDRHGISSDMFSDYIDHCVERNVSTVSAATYVFEVYRAATIMYPAKDWSLLRGCWLELDDEARPSKDKLIKYIPIDELFLFGVELMEAAELSLKTKSTAVQFRDGLFIALLCMRPKRVSNLGAMTIGDNIVLNADGDPIQLYFPNTKNDDESVSPFPEELIGYYKLWVDRYRPLLLESDVCGDIWVSRKGGALAPKSFWQRVSKRTHVRFGKGIGVHMFRSCYPTFFAGLGPQFKLAVQKMLDHRDDRSMKPYQLLAESMLASKQLDDVLDGVRREPRLEERRKARQM